MSRRYNDLLRGFGPHKDCKGNTYVTTTHAINSCIVKNSKLTKATKVFRGISGGMLPKSFSKLYAEGLFTFIPYPSGMGIIYSSDVAEHVARLMDGPLPLRTIWPHDAMSALWLAGVDVELRDDYRFHDLVGRGTVQGNCTDESLMIHYMTPEMWASVDACGCLACGTGVCPRCQA